jgi:3alpha(or 20beta)-hydroxysteroid dehydrogenase
VVARLDGKVALISGGARGMGAAHARTFVVEGARVVIGDIRDDLGKQVADELGEACTYVHLDVTDPDDWAAAVETAEHAYGPVSVLVNNAGIADWGHIADYPLERYRRILEIDLVGCFTGIQVSVPSLRRAGGGSVINISSIAGMQGYPQMAGYVSAKWAVRGLTKVAALDLAPDGIRANSVHPGQIDTPIVENAKDSASTDHVAMHRIGEPEEVSALLVFLASDESSFCTGAEFVVDGGEIQGMPTLALKSVPATPSGS